MTISLLCPGCNGKLTAPPTLAGKKVKCPKCTQLMIVPAPEKADDDFEVVDDEFEIVEEKTSPRKRPALDDEPPRRKRAELDDEDSASYAVKRRPDLDDEDRRPRKKKKKKSKSSEENTPLKIIGSVLGAILAIGIAGAGVWAKWYRLDKAKERLTGTKDKSKLESVGSGNASNVSSSWVNYQGAGWSAEFPGGPPTSDARLTSMARSQGAKGNVLGRVDGARLYLVYSETLPGGVPDPHAIANQVFAEMAKEDPTMNFTGSITVGGYPGRTVSFRDAQTQTQTHGCMILTKTRVLMYAVEGELTLSTNDAAVQRFLNSFNINY